MTRRLPMDETPAAWAEDCGCILTPSGRGTYDAEHPETGNVWRVLVTPCTFHARRPETVDAKIRTRADRTPLSAHVEDTAARKNRARPSVALNIRLSRDDRGESFKAELYGKAPRIAGADRDDWTRWSETPDEALDHIIAALRATGRNFRIHILRADLNQKRTRRTFKGQPMPTRMAKMAALATQRAKTMAALEKTDKRNAARAAAALARGEAKLAAAATRAAAAQRKACPITQIGGDFWLGTPVGKAADAMLAILADANVTHGRTAVRMIDERMPRLLECNPDATAVEIVRCLLARGDWKRKTRESLIALRDSF